jgi:2-desacetyl-2-hydroxyethyl bacteriochlorophyllide A dehydrogenase
MHASQAVITEPLRVEIRGVDLPAPAANQVLVKTEFSAVSAGTELAVFTGMHQWLSDPNLPDWKFPFRPGYSAAGEIIVVGREVKGWQPGDRVSYPGNHASAELLTLGHERGRLWKLPTRASAEAASWACVARYGLGAAIRVGQTLGRSVVVLGLGVIGQFALRSFKASGAFPIIGIDAIGMRREAALLGGADHVLDPAAGEPAEQLAHLLGLRGAEIVADATGVPDAVPVAMSLACDGGQVVVVGSPRGKAKDVNFYDHLHRRYLEVTGAHGNMLFEPSHTRLAGGWTMDKAQNWLLTALADSRLNLAGLVTHSILPSELGGSYEGLLNRKSEYLGVVVRWT